MKKKLALLSLAALLALFAAACGQSAQEEKAPDPSSEGGDHFPLPRGSLWRH